MALHKRRAWYAEDDDAGSGEQDGGNGQQGGKYDPADLDEAKRIIAALEKRVGERETQIGSLQTQINSLSERIDAKDKASKKQLEVDGKYKDLYEQAQAEIETLKPYKDQAERYRKVVESGNEKLIAQIPEDRRGIVPKLTPDELHEWLGASLPMLTRKAAPDMDAGAGANGGGRGGGNQDALSAAEKRAATGFNLKAEDLEKARKIAQAATFEAEDE